MPDKKIPPMNTMPTKNSTPMPEMPVNPKGKPGEQVKKELTADELRELNEVSK